MGVKKQHRLVLLLVCLILIGVTVYPHIPALVKTAQAVQGELKFGSTMDQVMTVINKTYYSADVFFGNGAGGTVGVLKGTGNVGIGTITPTTRLQIVGGNVKLDAGSQIIFGGGYRFSGGATGGFTDILTSDTAIRFKNSADSVELMRIQDGGNVGIGSTAPTKKLDVVGDINFSGTLYQGGVAYQGSQWTTASPNIYYNTGNVGIGTTAPGGTLDINGSLIYNGANANADIRLFGLNRSIGIASGDFVNIGSFSNNGTSNYTKFHISSHNGCVIQDDEFEVRQLAYLGTSTSWLELPVTHVSANHDGVQKYAIDVRVTNQSSTSQAMEARLRVKNGICGAGNVSIDIETNASFTADSTAGTGATIAGYWGSRNWDFPVTSGNSWNSATAGLFIANGGNVGIGTSAPAKKLDIVATNSTINNTSGNLSIVPNANLLITQGNVGIGSTGPNSKLHVYSTAANLGTTGGAGVAISGTSAWQGLGIDGPSSTKSVYLHFGGDTTNEIRFGRYADNFGGWEANPIRLDIDAPDSSLNLSGSGYLGIGRDPVYKLDVVGQGHFSRDGANECCSSGAFTLSLAENTASTSKKSKLEFHNSGQDEGYMELNPSPRRFVFGDHQSVLMGGQFTGGLAVGYTLPSNDNRLIVSGNVGIGTTGPNNRLQLSSDNSAQAFQFNTSGYIAANQWGTRMYKLDIGGGIPLKIETQNAATWYGSVDMDHGQDNAHPSLKTYYNTQLAVTSGNVGVGTTSPGQKLDVVGNAVISGNLNVNGASMLGVENGISDFGALLQSGFYQDNGQAVTGDVPDQDHPWSHLITSRHSNLGNNHQLQIAASYGVNDRLFFRKIAATLSDNPAWNEVATRATGPFNGSVLLNTQQKATINSWIGNPYQTWTLCFRKSTNGTSSAAWHAACDNKGQTVTIASLSTGQLMGGYAECSFTSRGGYYHGCGAGNFLFNLTKGHVYRFGGEILGNNNYAWYYGIYDASNYGPTFGGGHDWYVADGLNSGYCNLGYSYPCRKGTYGTAACQQDLCGTYNTWAITDLETWYVNN